MNGKIMSEGKIKSTGKAFFKHGYDGPIARYPDEVVAKMRFSCVICHGRTEIEPPDSEIVDGKMFIRDCQHCGKSNTLSVVAGKGVYSWYVEPYDQPGFYYLRSLALRSRLLFIARLLLLPLAILVGTAIAFALHWACS